MPKNPDLSLTLHKLAEKFPDYEFIAKRIEPKKDWIDEVWEHIASNRWTLENLFKEAIKKHQPKYNDLLQENRRLALELIKSDLIIRKLQDLIKTGKELLDPIFPRDD